MLFDFNYKIVTLDSSIPSNNTSRWYTLQPPSSISLHASEYVEVGNAIINEPNLHTNGIVNNLSTLNHSKSNMVRNNQSTRISDYNPGVFVFIF